MYRDRETLTALIRAGIVLNRDNSLLISDTNWNQVLNLAMEQNVVPQLLDGLEKLQNSQYIQKEEIRMPLIKAFALTQQVSVSYQQKLSSLHHLNAFYQQHGIRMMVLKGWALSLLYPVPEHRNCSDIDIYLFGDQRRADKLLKQQLGIKIDTSHHHHTVFNFEGASVENHYDFVNIYSHHSSAILDNELKRLSDGQNEQVDGIYLPPPTCHALFLLAHSAFEFASTNISLRQLIDWWLFTQKYSSEIDWDEVNRIAEIVGFSQFLPCMNDAAQELMEGNIAMSELSRRIYDDIWDGPDRKLMVSARVSSNYSAKLKRWWMNRWKNKLVYNEGLANQFLTLMKSHFINPYKG